MPLIEVIAGPRTDETVLARGRSLVVALERLPISVKSGPGYLVNRVLLAYLLEAIAITDEGVPPKLIDAAAVAFGMPMGPIALADSVGLDICLSVARALSQPLRLSVPASLERKVALGQMGRKVGRGFYGYPETRRRRLWPASRAQVPDGLMERLLMRLVNEAMRCVREGVVADADTLDLGLVYGMGFAPFRGGPLSYAESIGVGEVKGRLSELRARFGERFVPDSGWDDSTLLGRRSMSSG